MALPPKIRKLNVEKNEEKIDFLKLLLEKDMTHICFNILSKLDSKSFTNCRLVSHQWKEFIDYQFYKTLKGKQWIENRLTSNYLDENFTPREENINFKSQIFDFAASDFCICVLTEKDDYFDIHSFDFYSFKKNWSFNDANDFTENTFEELKSTPAAARNFCYELIIKKKRLYLYAYKMVANIYIINSDNGILLHKLCNIFPGAIFTIADVVDFENSILATCCVNGQLIFFDVKDLQSEPQKLYEEDIGFNPSLTSDKNLLYSSSENNEIITWNLDTRDKVHRFQLEISILDFVVKSPYVLVLEKHVDEDEASCVKIFNMAEKSLVKQINFKVLIYDIGIVGNFFFCQIFYKSHDNPEIENHKWTFYLLDEIMDKTTHKFTNPRDIVNSKTYEVGNTFEAIVNFNYDEIQPILKKSCVITREFSDNDEEKTQCIVKRSFWP